MKNTCAQHLSILAAVVWSCFSICGLHASEKSVETDPNVFAEKMVEKHQGAEALILLKCAMRAAQALDEGAKFKYEPSTQQHGGLLLIHHHQLVSSVLLRSVVLSLSNDPWYFVPFSQSVGKTVLEFRRKVQDRDDAGHIKHPLPARL